MLNNLDLANLQHEFQLIMIVVIDIDP